jgi:hypothetical protein
LHEFVFARFALSIDCERNLLSFFDSTLFPYVCPQPSLFRVDCHHTVDLFSDKRSFVFDRSLFNHRQCPGSTGASCTVHSSCVLPHQIRLHSSHSSPSNALHLALSVVRSLGPGTIRSISARFLALEPHFSLDPWTPFWFVDRRRSCSTRLQVVILFFCTFPSWSSLSSSLSSSSPRLFTVSPVCSHLQPFDRFRSFLLFVSCRPAARSHLSTTPAV